MSLQNTQRANRLPITEEDRRLIRKWKGGLGFISEVAKTVDDKQKTWLSPKQRKLLQRDENRSYGVRGRGYYRPDYEESDWDIGEFELCVGAWGD